MKFSVLPVILLCVLLSACVQTNSYGPKAKLAAQAELQTPIVVPSLPKMFKVEKNRALHAYLEQVVEKNKDLKSLAATVQAFELGEKIALAQARPSVTLGVTQQRNNDRIELTPDANVSLNAQWAVDIWNKLADQAKAAQLQTEQYELEYQNAQRVLVAQATQTWLALWRTQKQSSITSQRALNSDNLLSITEDYYLNGLQDYEAVIEQRETASRIQQELAQLDAQKQIHQHRLNSLRGTSGRMPIELLGDSVHPVVTELPLQISAISLQNRPDILRAFKEIEVLDAQTRAAHKALLPQLNLTGSLSSTSKTLAKTLTGDVLWQLAGGLTQVIFDTNQLRNNAKQKSKQAESAFYKYEQVVFDAMEEVENSLANEKALSAQLNLTQERLSETENRVGSNEEAYKDGSVSVLQYLQAKDHFLLIQNEWVEAQTNYLNNRIALALATGQSIQAKAE